MLHLHPEDLRKNADPAPQISPNARVMMGHNSVHALFGQDRWDLSAAEHHDGREEAQTVISFEYIRHPAIKQAAKELAYHRLNTRVMNATTLSAYTCAREQVRLKRFIRWLEDYHPDVTSLQDLNQLIIHAYHEWLKQHAADARLEGVSGGNHRREGEVAPETVWTYMSPIKSLDLFAALLSEPMNFSPYGGKLSSRFCGVVNIRGENKTPVVPDAVLHPVITVAMRYVENYHLDIEAMCSDVLSFWKLIEQHGRNTPWPGTTAQISNCAELGRPWRSPLGAADHHVNHEFRAEISHLQTSCAAIILYLSGMRPGELLTLKSGCLKEIYDPLTGEIVRWRVSGVALKKRQSKKRKAAAKMVHWVIPKAAAHAIMVLERVLQPFRELHGTKSLLLNLDAFRPNPEVSARGDFSLKVRSLERGVDAFLDMIRTRFKMPVEGGLNPMQLRRTLARHIARQPFGIIAGKLQYHHVKTVVFEGYAGSADDGFRDDVADEVLEAQVDLLDEMLRDADAGALLGPGANGIVQELRRLTAPRAGEAVVDTSAGEIAIKAALKNLAGRLHVALLNFCIFRPETALCLTETEAKAEDVGPKINLCSPDKCGNSVIGACHVPQWKTLLDDVESLKKEARNPLQKASLDQQAKRYKRVLAPLRPEGSHAVQ